MIVRTMEEFTDYIDSLSPLSATELEQWNNISMDMFYSIIEENRNKSIKDKISSTHSWCLTGDWYDVLTFEKDVIACMECKIICSPHENVGSLQDIKFVRDYLPSYTTHNRYLRFTCEEVQRLTKNCSEAEICRVCGLPCKICKLDK